MNKTSLVIIGTFLGISLFGTMPLFAQTHCTVTGAFGSIGDRECDGIADVFDNCPDVRNGNCGARTSNCDIDEDGVISDIEAAGGGQADFDDDNLGDACDDSDKDTVLDAGDNCPDVSNTDQADSDADGFGDLCSDVDNDSFVGPEDNCPAVYNTPQEDTDGDGVGDACDVCRFLSNPAPQQDSDADGVGDLCEGDADSDGILDGDDNCILTPNYDQKNDDADAFGNVCDNCPNAQNNDQLDANQNDIGDACEGSAALNPNPLQNPGLLDDHLRMEGSGGCGSSIAPVEANSLLGSMISFGSLTLPLLLARRRRLR